MKSFLDAFGYYVLGPLIKLWMRGVELRAQAIAAATPDFDDEPVVEDIPQRKKAESPPCGMRIVLTREQVEQSIADLDRQFPKTKDRRIR